LAYRRQRQVSPDKDSGLQQQRISSSVALDSVHRDDGKRFVVNADEKLTAFIELERVIRESLRFLIAE
jgi:hypothetical protein